MTRPWTGFVAILAIVLCAAPFNGRGLAEGEAQRVALDDVLAAYLGGDFEVVQRTFVRSLDFQNRLRIDRPRELDRWLGSWNRGKALLLLEFARRSATIAPQYVFVIVGSGRRYLVSNTVPSDGGADFVRLWHRAAMGLLQGVSDPIRIEEHVADAGVVDERTLLARAIAQERRCWAHRPSIDQPAVRVDGLLAIAGAEVPDDSVGPSKSEKEAMFAKHSTCLREALSRFEAAARVEDNKAEALVRGGWVLIQDGRPKEAIEWLDAAAPRDDKDLEYWHGLFRGRALESLARSQEAADAYRAALALYPGAQSAGLGLALALMHLDRTREADEIARSIRGAGITTPDPWFRYGGGDQRFAGQWIDSLRTAVR